MSQILFFTPKFGLIEWSNKKALYEFLLANEGKEMYAKIDKVKSVRSLDQNSFYWRYLEIIATETGNNADDLHRIFKGLFLPKRKTTFKGKDYMMSGSTTELSKTEMGEYLDKICALTNVPIPDPKLVAMDNKIEYPRDSNETKF
jgi:hypothetical protein